MLFAVPLTAIFGAWLEGHPLVHLGGLSIGAPFGALRRLGGVLDELESSLTA